MKGSAALNPEKLPRRQTRQRAALTEILEGLPQPATALEIYHILLQAGQNANLSTVYRNLERLAEEGILQKLHMEGQASILYEPVRQRHRHYLICTGCKSMLPVSHCPLGDYEKGLEAQTGYQIEGHKLSLYGLCPACQKK